jgi:hypothetical protein
MDLRWPPVKASIPHSIGGTINRGRPLFEWKRFGDLPEVEFIPLARLSAPDFPCLFRFIAPRGELWLNTNSKKK